MALKITIKVHDVGYRLFLMDEADSLFIPCFDARNVKVDGKEVLVVLVDGEKEQLEQFVEFAKNNMPEGAVVEDIKVEEYKGRVRDIERFRNSFNTHQLSKIVQVGVQMLGKQDKMLEKQDLALEKQDKMLEKQDLMLEKQDKMLEKQDETVKGIKDVSKKLDRTNELLEKKFDRLEQEVERIKKALIRAGIEI